MIWDSDRLLDSSLPYNYLIVMGTGIGMLEEGSFGLIISLKRQFLVHSLKIDCSMCYRD